MQKSFYGFFWYSHGRFIIVHLKRILVFVRVLEVIKGLIFCKAVDFLKEYKTNFLAFFVIKEILVLGWKNINQVINLCVDVGVWTFFRNFCFNLAHFLPIWKLLSWDWIRFKRVRIFRIRTKLWRHMFLLYLFSKSVDFVIII